MSGVSTYQPGSFFLTQVGGVNGFLIGLGQALCGSPSRYSHGGVVIDADGTTVEAEPGGARYGHLSDYAGRPLLVSDAPVRGFYTPGRQSLIPPGGKDHESNEDEVRRYVTWQARQLIGTPYSALDYLALALLHLHLPSGWVRRRVESSGHMQCAQLVDAVYERAGIHLFSDGRLPGDVMPSDLAAWAEDQQGVQW